MPTLFNISNLKTCLSVVVPTLNERNNLPLLIASIAGADEIIIADGGSDDGTREWVQNQPGLRLLDAPRGRGNQLAVGAKAATGELLLFLHADCVLPPDALTLLRQTMTEESIVGGCFSVRFAEQTSPALTATAGAINFHSRLTGTATGDQAIFVRYADYLKVGGFPDWPLFEDVRLVANLRRVGRFVVLPNTVTISARRWQKFGVARTNTLMACLWIGYRLGVSPAFLKRRFADVRPAPQGASS